jgi:hypothetical protein
MAEHFLSSPVMKFSTDSSEPENAEQIGEGASTRTRKVDDVAALPAVKPLSDRSPARGAKAGQDGPQRERVGHPGARPTPSRRWARHRIREA